MSNETLDLLRDVRDLLERIGTERGHGCSYTARETHPKMFARLDAALQSQPAAPLRLDQIDLEPLKAELSDPAKAKAFLQKHGFLNASGELAERYGGKPDQPAAAGVSDDDLQAIDDAHNWQTTAGRMAAYRAILALRPQAVPMTPKEVGKAYFVTQDKTDREPTFADGIAAAEAHHGITAQGAQGGEAK